MMKGGHKVAKELHGSQGHLQGLIYMYMHESQSTSYSKATKMQECKASKHTLDFQGGPCAPLDPIWMLIIVAKKYIEVEVTSVYIAYIAFHMTIIP